MQTLREHLFCAASDGALYDTRTPDWHKRPPLRPHYAQMPHRIASGADVRAALRAIPRALHDASSLAFLTVDGELVCADCVRAELRSVLDSVRHASDDGWLVLAVVGCYGGESETGDICAHCNKQLSEPRSAFND